MQNCSKSVEITWIHGRRLKIPAEFVKALSLKAWDTVSIAKADCRGFVLDFTGHGAVMYTSCLIRLPKQVVSPLENKKRTRYYVYMECPRYLHVRKIEPCCTFCGNPNHIQIVADHTFLCDKCRQEMDGGSG